MQIKVTVTTPRNLGADLGDFMEEVAAISLRNLAMAMESNWIKLASQKLHTSFKDYVQSLQVEPHRKGLQYDFSIGGFLPLAVELGFPPFDMKPSMLWHFQYSGNDTMVSASSSSSFGSKVRQGKNGPYLIVPFRFSTSKTPSEKSNLNWDRQALQGIKILQRLNRSRGAAREKAVRTFSAWNKTIGVGPVRPGEMRKNAKGGDYLHGAGAQTVAKSGYISKVGKAKNLTQTKQTVGGKSRSSYSTFRTVSERSDPRSWIHPGIRARLLHMAVIKNISKMAGAEVKSVIGSITKGKV